MTRIWSLSRLGRRPGRDIKSLNVFLTGNYTCQALRPFPRQTDERWRERERGREKSSPLTESQREMKCGEREGSESEERANQQYWAVSPEREGEREREREREKEGERERERARERGR